MERNLNQSPGLNDKADSVMNSIDQDIADLGGLIGSPAQKRRSRKNRNDDDSDIVEDDEGNLHRQESILSGSFYQKNKKSGSKNFKEAPVSGSNNVTGVNTVAPGDIAAHDQFLDEMLQSQQQKHILGTEVMIEKMLENLDVIDDENLDVWNMQDEAQEPDSRKNISYIKMVNEINQREARMKDADGKMKPFSFCGSSPGWHSSKRKYRTGNLECLGPGVNLYLKMLKYFACWFFVFTILALPIIAIYGSGSAFYDQNKVAALVGRSSLGNLGISQSNECAYVNIESLTGTQKKTKLNFECKQGDNGKGYTMDSIKSFGLAYKAQTCTGLGLQMSVQTIAKCSLGAQASLDTVIQEAFKAQCVGKRSCEMDLDLLTMFSTVCQYEIQRRQAGNIVYGDAKLYGLAQCKNMELNGVFGELSRESASMFIVWFDSFIILLFVMAVFRLRWYEELVEKDRQLKHPKTEDFSIFLPLIPIQEKDYSIGDDISPELLTVQMATHLEDILVEKFQTQNQLSEFEAQDLSQVSSINYGLTQHHPMHYLVTIAEEVKKIIILRKKIRSDPMNSHSYEQSIWNLYSKITGLKEQYYLVKERGIEPKIINAYVTFRDIQARNKMLELYSKGPIRRWIIQNVCCGCYHSRFYPRMLLLEKGMYGVEGSVDPATILWENLGTPIYQKIGRWTGTGTVIGLVFACSFFGLWGIQLFEKLHTYWVKSDCSGNDYYSIDDAFEDYLLPEDRQQGLMECYCEQMWDRYDQRSLAIIFEDGESYCKEWYMLYFSQDYVNFILALWIAFGNWCIQEIFNYIGKFRNTKNISDNFTYRTVTIFIFQYVNNALMFIFAYHNMFLSSEHSSDKFIGPFEDLNVRWYLVIAVPIVMAIFLQIFMPHFGLLMLSIKMGILRCWDRSCTLNARKTRQITQDEYENLYTGPEFILQLRYAQILSMTYVCITYSSCVPILYPVAFLSFFITYWTDKFLLLRYFRVANQFTAENSKAVVMLLPYAAVLHYIVGIFSFSFPEIMNSKVLDGAAQNDSYYFNTQRMGQNHMVWFTICFVIVVFMLIAETPIVWLLSNTIKFISFAFRKVYFLIICKKFEPSIDENDEVIDAPDYYFEINFAQLCKEYKLQKMERQKYTKLKQNQFFSMEQSELFVDKYISLIKRNEKDIFDRIVELTDKYIGNCDNSDNIFVQEEKIKAVREYYAKATDWDNPNRGDFKVDDEMHGRIIADVMSYNLMDNDKYKDIEELLEIMEKNDQDEQTSGSIKRSTTFAGMDSYYKKSKTFHYGQSPEQKLKKIPEDEPDAEGLIELQQMENSNETDNAEKTNANINKKDANDGMF